MTDVLRIEHSGGVLGLTGVDLGAGAEGPVGDHEAADHGYYVLEGELAVRLGEEEPLRLGTGAVRVRAARCAALRHERRGRR